jgi:hypothetical protein
MPDPLQLPLGKGERKQTQRASIRSQAREGTPSKELAGMSRLTDFYRGAGTDNRGRTLADIWAYSDEEMEDVHDFIQWIFPLEEPSQFNPEAPLLSPGDIAEFRADPSMRANLLRSLELFLAFVGLEYRDGRVSEAQDFERKRDVWRYPNHNWLRITRVLTSTRTLGLEGESRAFFEFLRGLRESGMSGITADTFRYWQQAAPTGPDEGGRTQ